MNAILAFKALEDDDIENCPCGTELRDRLNAFHHGLMSQVSLTALQEAAEEAEAVTDEKPSMCLFSFCCFFNTLKYHIRPS